MDGGGSTSLSHAHRRRQLPQIAQPEEGIHGYWSAISNPPELCGHVLKGEVLAPESDAPQLKVYWERHIAGEPIPQCEMIFPLRDEAERKFPVQRSGEGWTHNSTYTVKLHLESVD